MQKSFNNQMSLYFRIRDHEYEFIREIARLYTWGKLTHAMRLCLDYAKKNEDDFNKFVENLRQSGVKI